MGGAVAADGELQFFGQRVYNRNADAVQSAGNFVGVVVEFPAGVELGHDDFGGGAAFAGVNVHRDSASVVLDGDGVVQMQGDGDFVAESGQRLVDGVVHHFVNHVVQSGAVGGVADIHARALADRLQPAQDLDLRGVVVPRILGGLGFGDGGHYWTEGKAGTGLEYKRAPCLHKSSVFRQSCITRDWQRERLRVVWQTVAAASRHKPCARLLCRTLPWALDALLLSGCWQVRAENSRRRQV